MSVLVFDMETRVDTALLRAVYYRDAVGEGTAFERMRDELRREGGDFFPLSLHVPISIAVAEADDAYVLQQVEVLGADRLGEAGLVRTFWERLEQFDGQLVSFNGRGFDLPVLELQALRHGCAAPRYFGERGGLRTRGGRHCDLYDVLTNGGAARVRGGLDLVAKLVGLPGKREVSGADVQLLWQRGCWADIHRYCRDDVLQTYFVFLRVARLRGELSAEQLAHAEHAAQAYRAELGGTMARAQSG